jgi:hypothetical protein
MPEPHPSSCGSISPGNTATQHEYDAYQTGSVWQPGSAAPGVRFGGRNKRFQKFPQSLRQQFGSHCIPLVRRDALPLFVAARKMRFC